MGIDYRIDCFSSLVLAIEGIMAKAKAKASQDYFDQRVFDVYILSLFHKLGD